jgi:hypothetical protein
MAFFPRFTQLSLDSCSVDPCCSSRTSPAGKCNLNHSLQQFRVKKWVDMASKSQQDYDQPKEAGTPSSKSSTSILRSLVRTNPQTEDGKAAIRARFQKIVRSVPAAKYNSYKHEPIDYDNEIRILRILRGSSDDRLECMLMDMIEEKALNPYLIPA